MIGTGIRETTIKAAVRYRNPADSSQEWIGRARQPSCVKELIASGKDLHPASTVQGQVVRLALLAARAGCHGVVASPQEASLPLERLPPEMLIVTPGTQLPGDAKNDQARTATPSTHVVIGRSIVNTLNPGAAFSAVCAQIEPVFVE